MLMLLFVLFLAVFVGILTGLLPALPVYTGPFILYYFGADVPLEYLIVFWLVVVTGSQFFGSIATITTQIPGEESATVYLKDIPQLTRHQKNGLLYETAKGSFIAGILSLLFIYLIFNFFGKDDLLLLSSISFQVVFYTLVI